MPLKMRSAAVATSPFMTPKRRGDSSLRKNFGGIGDSIHARFIALLALTGIAVLVALFFGLRTLAQTGASRVMFHDVAVSAGVTPTLICGTPKKAYILEVAGTGGAWFDYNNDGFLDLYLVNGSTMQHLLGAAASTETFHNYLY